MTASVAEKAAKQGRALLIASARKKLAAGKAPTSRELNAIRELEEEQQAEKEATTATAPIASNLCERLVNELKPDATEETVRLILGNRTVRTLAEVAKEFGVQPTYLRSGWRTQGMPGKPNKFDLAEIVMWRLKHLAAVEKKSEERPLDTFARRKNEAEARKVELEVEKREQEMALSSGRLVDRSVIVPAIRALLSKAAEWLSTVGDEIEPELPVEIAKEKAARINDLNARALQAVAEMAARDIAALVPNA